MIYEMAFYLLLYLHVFIYVYTTLALAYTYILSTFVIRVAFGNRVMMFWG